MAGDEQGDGGATALLEEALRCSQGASASTRGFILSFLGGILADDPERARTLSQEAVSVARAAEDRWMLGERPQQPR